MKENTKILIRLLAVEFYRSNVALFLLFLAFAGGFMRSQDHIALAEYFISTGTLLLIPVSVWTIYCLFVADYNRSNTSRQENAFLAYFLFFPAKWQWIFSLRIIAIQLLPVYLYAVFLSIVTLKNNFFQPLMFILSSTGAVTFLSAWQLRNALRNPALEQNVHSIWQFVGKSFVRPFVLFPIESALRTQLIAIAGYKIAGMALLAGALHLYHTDSYDSRLAGIAVVFSYAMNITFVLSCHRFLHFDFSIFRQQPFSLMKRYGLITVILMLFSSPEALLLIRNTHESFSLYDAVVMMTLGLSINLFFFHYLYMRNRDPEKMMPFVYTLTMVSFLAILAGFPPGTLAAIYLLVSFFLSWKFYPLFEYTAD